jgi:Lipocalin-like domain
LHQTYAPKKRNRINGSRAVQISWILQHEQVLVPVATRPEGTYRWISGRWKMASVVGAWRLVAVHAWDEAGASLPPLYGDAPLGAAVFTDTWMTATVVPPKGQATRPFVAYHGAYSFDGETLITRVEAATIASWVGEDQVRSSRFQGDDRLFLRPPIREFGSQRVQQELEWVRVG